MKAIAYKYIDFKSEIFNEVINLRFEVLFKPYKKIEKYSYDNLDSESLHLVAIDVNEKVVGYSRMTKVNRQAKITNVVVNAEFSRCGIGLSMIKTHIERAKKENINYIYLNSRINTIEFYKRLGFEECGNPIMSKKSGLELQKMYMEI